MIENRLFINNEWLTPSNCEFLTAINPSNESIISKVLCAGQTEVDLAVQSARDALNSSWKQINPWDRGRIMMRISELIKERAHSLIEMEMLETGKPRDFACSAIDQVARYFEFYAGMADKIQGSSIPLQENYIDFTIREPIGVTAHIVPWNAPLNMLARGVAPALAAGCTAVVKPAEQTPLGSLQLAQIMLDAGLPAGVCNIVNGYGRSTGATLASHPDIDLMVFTGSVTTGQTIMNACASNIKPVILELGGKSPLIVFEDTSAEYIAQEAIKGIFSNTGQYCDAGSRLLIAEKKHDEVVECLLKQTQKITVDIPEKNANMGPLISSEQEKRIQHYIKLAQQEGATLVTGGGKPSHLKKGYFIEPTIFTNVKNSHTIAKEEIFGPVLSIMKFRTEEEAIALANGTDYGLAAGIFTANIDRVLRLTKRLEAGTIYVNEYFSGEMASPFGGVKKSGIGREKGLETLENYTRIKNVIIKVST